VFLLTAIGPQDLVSSCVAGAEFRYALLWVLIPVLTIRYAILEATARYVLASGESLMEGFARVGGPLLLWILLLLFLAKRFLAGLSQILLMGSALVLMMPPGMPGGRTTWAVVSWAAGFGLVYGGRYHAVEKVDKPLLMLLGGSIILAAFASQPDWGQAARGLLVPTIPKGEGLYSTGLILMAVVGSGAASLSNLKYASFVREKGWRDISFLKRQRVDLFATGLLFLIILMLLQVAAAATLGVSGTELKDAMDVLPLFTTSLGEFGRIAFAIGLWTAVFTTFIGADAGDSMIVADIWHNALRVTPAQNSADVSTTPAYRAAIVAFSVPPLIVLFTSWQPVWLSLLASMLQGALTPLVILIVLWLCNSRRLMGTYANRWISNTTLAVAMIATLYLTWLGAADLWRRWSAS
jgi:Mn2+/Fe2+ NRAMP family transporter